MANYLNDKEAYQSLSVIMQKKRDHFISLMKETRFTLQPSFGSYFICGTYEKISEESDKEFAIRLTKEIGVATIPVSAFYQEGTDNKVLRFCFSKKNETLEKAVIRICKL
jgi:methionine aminotransferase